MCIFYPDIAGIKKRKRRENAMNFYIEHLQQTIRTLLSTLMLIYNIILDLSIHIEALTTC